MIRILYEFLFHIYVILPNGDNTMTYAQTTEYDIGNNIYRNICSHHRLYSYNENRSPAFGIHMKLVGE